VAYCRHLYDRQFCILFPRQFEVLQLVRVLGESALEIYGLIPHYGVWYSALLRSLTSISDA
jgi:hypothetical protein